MDFLLFFLLLLKLVLANVNKIDKRKRQLSVNNECCVNNLHSITHISMSFKILGNVRTNLSINQITFKRSLKRADPLFRQFF